GGSSGGAAVALACGMVPIADGSDTGGSLRNPANFCNVVGFRTSPGRVPVHPTELGWFPISVQGPMARTVEDTALMLSVLAGPDPRVPISLAEPGETFRGSLERDFHGVRVAWSRDLGSFPVDDAVAGALESQLGDFSTIGCSLDHAHPDFRDADFCFKTLRAWAFESKFSPLLEEHRDKIKETIIWNAEAGQQQSGPDIARAERLRTALFHRVREFMDDYEFLVLPVSQVAPFDVETPYITEINGQSMETYIDWMMSCYFITVTGLPALSLPLGFTDEGLPVGLQIVGRHQDDFGVLQLAYAIQQANGSWQRRPGVVDA
ncbi:MAG TPA: amidase, partial [Planctomycetaceae bacterium]|nr:amidase [Planctomycetaceae bacterium]